MKYKTAILATLAMLAITSAAQAHERQVFDVDDRLYLFTVGSINEPISIDDRSGVDLRVQLADPRNVGQPLPTPRPIEGLNTSLQVEVIAGGKKRLLPLEPVFRDPGAYRATFIPTIATSYTYRVFGQLDEGQPIDVLFTCNSEGHVQTADDKSKVNISDNLRRTFKSGSFDCPRSANTIQFPEETSTNHETDHKIASQAKLLHTTIAIAVISLILAVIALRRKS